MYDVKPEAYTKNDVAMLQLLWYRAAVDTIDEYILGDKGLQPTQPPRRERPGWQKLVGKVSTKVGKFIGVTAGTPTLVQKPAPTFDEFKTALEDEIKRLQNLVSTGLPATIVNGLSLDFAEALEETLGEHLAKKIGTNGKSIPLNLAAAIRAYFRTLTWAKIMEQLKNRYIQALNGENQKLPRPWTTIDRIVTAPPRTGGEPARQYRCVITPVNEEFDPTFSKLGTTGFASMAPRLTLSDDRKEQHRPTNLWHSRFLALPGEETLLFECFRSGAVCYPFDDVSENVRKAAAVNKARELLTAVLLRNLERMTPEARDKILIDREPARIKLVSVSLQTALASIPLKGEQIFPAMKDMVERKGIDDQFRALQTYDTKTQPVKLDIKWEGRAKKVAVFFGVATFNFGVNGAIAMPGTDAVAYQDDLNRKAMEKLGPWYDEWLATQNEEKEAIQNRLGGNLSEADRNDLTQKHIAVDRRIRFATQLRAQFDALIFSGSTVYDSPSRLTTLAHLMGCTVHFNCKSGKDRTSVLALESHFLAWQMHERDLVPPYQNKLTGDAKLFHRRLVFESGNLEIQRYNTGIPGYKIVPKKIFEGELAKRFGKHLQIATGLCRRAVVSPKYDQCKDAKTFEPMTGGECLEIAERFVNPR